MREEEDSLDQLLQTKVKGYLESYGYMQMIRAKLKVLGLQTARQQAQNGSITETDSVKPVPVDEEDKQLLKEISGALLAFGLDNSAKMLDLETGLAFAAESPENPELLEKVRSAMQNLSQAKQ